MSINFSKSELYDLYNLLGGRQNDKEISNEFETSEEIEKTIHTLESILNKIRTAYQGLQDDTFSPLDLTIEEALITVESLIHEITRQDMLSVSEEDPTSYHAECSYNMEHLKQRIQAHFKQKLAPLWAEPEY